MPWRASSRCGCSTMDEARQVLQALLRRKQTVSTAESCTGGLLGKLLTDLPGSSAVYPGGVISYCDEVKHQILGVEQTLLETLGAVSEPVAAQMACGIRQLLHTDFGLATTGLAGPEGDGSGKPVGLVYVALADERGARVQTLHLSGGRDEIRCQASRAAFSMLLQALGEK